MSINCILLLAYKSLNCNVYIYQAYAKKKKKNFISKLLKPNEQVLYIKEVKFKYYKLKSPTFFSMKHSKNKNMRLKSQIQK